MGYRLLVCLLALAAACGESHGPGGEDGGAGADAGGGCTFGLGERVRVLDEPGHVSASATGPGGELWLVWLPDARPYQGVFLLRIDDSRVTARTLLTAEVVSGRPFVVLSPEGPIVIWPRYLWGSYDPRIFDWMTSAFDWAARPRGTAQRLFRTRASSHVSAAWLAGRAVVVFSGWRVEAASCGPCTVELDASGAPIGGYPAMDDYGMPAPRLTSFLESSEHTISSPVDLVADDGDLLVLRLGASLTLMRLDAALEPVSQWVFEEEGSATGTLDRRAVDQDGRVALNWRNSGGDPPRVTAVVPSRDPAGAVVTRRTDRLTHLMWEGDRLLAVEWTSRRSPRELRLYSRSLELTQRVELGEPVGLVRMGGRAVAIDVDEEGLWIAPVECL